MLNSAAKLLRQIGWRRSASGKRRRNSESKRSMQVVPRHLRKKQPVVAQLEQSLGDPCLGHVPKVAYKKGADSLKECKTYELEAKGKLTASAPGDLSFPMDKLCAQAKQAVEDYALINHYLATAAKHAAGK